MSQCRMFLKRLHLLLFWLFKYKHSLVTRETQGWSPAPAVFFCKITRFAIGWWDIDPREYDGLA